MVWRAVILISVFLLCSRDQSKFNCFASKNGAHPILFSDMDTKNLVIYTSVTEVLFATMLASLACFIIVYKWKRRKLEKLAEQFPGPPALPIIGNALEFLGSPEDNLKNVLRITEQYNYFLRFWFGQKLIINIHNPEDLQIVLNNSKSMNKGYVYKLLTPVIGNGLVTAPTEIWRKHRRVMDPAFNRKLLDQYIPVFSKCNKELVDKLRLHINTGQFDISKYILSTTFDIVDESFVGLGEIAEKKHECEDIMLRMADILNMRLFKFWMHPDFIFNLTSYGSEFYKLLQQLNGICHTLIDNKKKEYKLAKEKKFEKTKDTKTNVKVLIDFLLETLDSRESFSDEELRDELITMLGAGIETTSQTICFMILRLAIHQDIQEKVYDEIFSIFGSSDCEVTMKSLKQMEYTEMVIKETMRWYPAAPLILREVEEDIELSNHWILPAGCSALIMPLTIHMDREAFPNPEIFNPENFTPERIAQRHYYSYLPFAKGPRACIGRPFAMLSMKTSLVHLIQNYKFFTDMKKDDIKLKSDLVLRCTKGFPVKIIPRQ